MKGSIYNEPKSLFSLVEQGDLGVKTGKGFYDYHGRKLEEVLKERDSHLLKNYIEAEIKSMIEDSKYEINRMKKNIL